MDINSVIQFLREYDGEDISIMEVCGTHTASISENAIDSIISSKIHLISGPGCPVCVTVSSYVDRLCQLALEGNTIVTFGDMIRVPGSKYALKDIKAMGGEVKMVYSPMEALTLASENKSKQFVFAAVGFETTTPIYAVLIDEMLQKGITNLRLLTALKTMPNVISTICESDSTISGFLAPGHVAAITGSEAFERLAKKHNVPFVVSGFKGEEILASVYALVKLQGQGKCLNLYKQVVKEQENKKAAMAVNKYLEPYDAPWRGLGVIKGSGMKIKDEYSKFDAGSQQLVEDFSFQNGCSCGDVIIGKKKPNQCPLFKKLCTPENPRGACMVSGEGACFNYYVNNRG